jgi:hypothetical protein
MKLARAKSMLLDAAPSIFVGWGAARAWRSAKSMEQAFSRCSDAEFNIFYNAHRCRKFFGG